MELLTAITTTSYIHPVSQKAGHPTLAHHLAKC